MWRSVAGSTIRATASETSGNSWRIPVWNSSGSSATTRYWLNGMPTSGMKVEMRWMPSAISWVVVSIGGVLSGCEGLERERVCEEAGALGAAGDGADELDRVHADGRTARIIGGAAVVRTAGDAFELEGERLVEVGRP